MSIPEKVVLSTRNEKRRTVKVAAKPPNASVVMGKVSRSGGQTPGTPKKGGPAARALIGAQPARRIPPVRTRLEPADQAISMTSAADMAEAGNAETLLYMSRVVIGNAGRPLAALSVPEKIRDTFGVAVARSLPQLLTKRARSSKSGFYLTADNLIGLIDTEPVGSTLRP